MKTTIDIPDALYPELLAASQASGLTLGEYLVRSAAKSDTADRVASPSDDRNDEATRPLTLAERLGPAFGSGSAEAVAEVQAIIDEEFSKIDPRDWE